MLGGRFRVASALALAFAVQSLSACDSDDSLWPPEEGDDDSGTDAASRTDGTVSPADANADHNVPDAHAPDAAPDVLTIDASDSSIPDGSDASTIDASDASLLDASEASTDAADASTLDASDASDAAADAADASVVDAGPAIPCTPVAIVDAVYFGRYDGTDGGVGGLPDGGAAPYGTIWRVHGDGTGEEYIGEGNRPRIAPDRTHLAYQYGGGAPTTGSIYVRDLSSPNKVPTLVFGTNTDHVVSYAFTSDNASLVYDYAAGFFTVGIDGTGAKSLFTYVDDFSDGPAISRFDDRIAFHNAGFGLGIANGDGSSPATIANSVAGDTLPAWSADGQWLAFVHTGGDVYKMKPDGTGRAKLTANLQPGEGFVAGGVVTDDSASWVGLGTLRGVRGVYLVPFDGSGAYQRICTAQGGVPIDFVGGLTAP